MDGNRNWLQPHVAWYRDSDTDFQTTLKEPLWRRSRWSCRRTGLISPKQEVQVLEGGVGRNDSRVGELSALALERSRARGWSRTQRFCGVCVSLTGAVTDDLIEDFSGFRRPLSAEEIETASRRFRSDRGAP
jgi:hypothetical protein